MSERFLGGIPVSESTLVWERDLILLWCDGASLDSRREGEKKEKKKAHQQKTGTVGDGGLVPPL